MNAEAERKRRGGSPRQGRLVFDYELTEAQLARGLRDSTRFRRQLLLLATLTVPALFVLMLWPQFRWWMLPFVVALLAFRALRVPAKVARHSFKAEPKRSGSVELDEAGVVARGVVEGKGSWADVTAFDESSDSFQLQFSRGPLLVLPKQGLSASALEGLLAFRARVPPGSQRGHWALFLSSLALALALHLGLWHFGRG